MTAKKFNPIDVIRTISRINFSLELLVDRIDLYIDDNKFGYYASGLEVTYNDVPKLETNSSPFVTNYDFFNSLKFDVNALLFKRAWIDLIFDDVNFVLSYTISYFDENDTYHQSETLSTEVYINDISLIDLMLQRISEIF